MPSWPRTLRARLTLWYTAALTAMLLVLGGVAAALLDLGMRENIDASLLSAARTVAKSTGRASSGAPDLDEVIESMLGPALAERFFRLLDPRGRGGTGLGLALAQSIAVAHGGRVSVDSELGRGSRFILVLPLHQARPAGELGLT